MSSLVWILEILRAELWGLAQNAMAEHLLGATKAECVKAGSAKESKSLPP